METNRNTLLRLEGDKKHPPITIQQAAVAAFVYNSLSQTTCLRGVSPFSPVIVELSLLPELGELCHGIVEVLLVDLRGAYSERFSFQCERLYIPRLQFKRQHQHQQQKQQQDDDHDKPNATSINTNSNGTRGVTGNYHPEPTPTREEMLRFKVQGNMTSRRRITRFTAHDTGHSWLFCIAATQIPTSAPTPNALLLALQAASTDTFLCST